MQLQSDYFRLSTCLLSGNLYLEQKDQLCGTGQSIFGIKGPTLWFWSVYFWNKMISFVVLLPNEQWVMPHGISTHPLICQNAVKNLEIVTPLHVSAQLQTISTCYQPSITGWHVQYTLYINNTTLLKLSHQTTSTFYLLQNWSLTTCSHFTIHIICTIWRLLTLHT